MQFVNWDWNEFVEITTIFLYAFLRNIIENPVSSSTTRKTDFEKKNLFHTK